MIKINDSLILKTFKAIIENNDKVFLDDSEENYIQLAKLEDKNLENIKIELTSNDLTELIKNIYSNSYSPMLNEILIFFNQQLDKISERENLFQKIRIYEAKIQELNTENEKLKEELSKLKEILKKESNYFIEEILNKDLKRLYNLSIGRGGNWKDFQFFLKKIFTDYLKFRELPRTLDRDEVLQSNESKINDLIEKDKNKERGTIDIHLCTTNAKKFKTIHIEAKKSSRKAGLDASNILDHQEKSKADILLVIGPDFELKSIYNLIRECREYQKKQEDFHFTIIGTDALKEIIKFIVKKNLTQDFLIRILSLDSLIIHEEKIQDFVNRMKKADNKNLNEYFSEKVILNKKDLDIYKIKDAKMICEEFWEEEKRKYPFREIIEQINDRWNRRINYIHGEFNFARIAEIISNSLVNSKFIGNDINDVENKIKLIKHTLIIAFFLCFLKYIEFIPELNTIEQLMRLINELKVEIKIDEKNITDYIRNRLKYLIQFF
ncbi:MAG: hypothetical protein ACTSVV_12950 [Promethearchaeota archaeon]